MELDTNINHQQVIEADFLADNLEEVGQMLSPNTGHGRAVAALAKLRELLAERIRDSEPLQKIQQAVAKAEATVADYAHADVSQAVTGSREADDASVLRGLGELIRSFRAEGKSNVVRFLEAARNRRLDRIANRPMTPEQADTIIAAVNASASREAQAKLDRAAEGHQLAELAESDA